MRHRLAIGAVLTALTIVAAPALGHPGHGPSEVEVGDDFFRSNDVRAVTGDTVMWTWLGPAGEHSVSSDPGRAESFDSDRPVIRSASVRPARVCADSAPGCRATRAYVYVRMSERSTVVARIERELRGRWKLTRTLDFDAAKGRDRHRLHVRGFEPGPYRARLVAYDAVGNRSRGRQVRFRIGKPL